MFPGSAENEGRKRLRLTEEGGEGEGATTAHMAVEGEEDEGVDLRGGLDPQVFGQLVRFIQRSSGNNRSSMTPTKAQQLAHEVGEHEV